MALIPLDGDTVGLWSCQDDPATFAALADDAGAFSLTITGYIATGPSLTPDDEDRSKGFGLAGGASYASGNTAAKVNALHSALRDQGCIEGVLWLGLVPGGYLGTVPHIFALGDNASVRTMRLWVSKATRRLGVSWDGTGTTGASATAGALPTAPAYFAVNRSYDAGTGDITHEFWIEGVLMDTRVNASRVGSHTGGRCVLGQDSWLASNHWMYGALQSLRVSNRVRTQEEIEAMQEFLFPTPVVALLLPVVAVAAGTELRLWCSAALDPAHAANLDAASYSVDGGAIAVDSVALDSTAAVLTLASTPSPGSHTVAVGAGVLLSTDGASNTDAISETFTVTLDAQSIEIG